MTEEEWRPIQDYPDYQISNLGRVKSLKYGGERIRSAYTPTDDRHRISLSRDGKKYNTTIYRLMAIAFIPNPDNKPCVDHINGIMADNRLVNLRWATYQENKFNSQKSNNKRVPKGVSETQTLLGVRYRAMININGKNTHLGSFATPEEAHACYIATARELHGDYFREIDNGGEST